MDQQKRENETSIFFLANMDINSIFTNEEDTVHVDGNEETCTHSMWGKTISGLENESRPWCYWLCEGRLDVCVDVGSCVCVCLGGTSSYGWFWLSSGPAEPVCMQTQCCHQDHLGLQKFHKQSTERQREHTSRRRQCWWFLYIPGWLRWSRRGGGVSVFCCLFSFWSYFWLWFLCDE